jgi:L-alanine-DL-glutamate epimerase-like enolase superfamily enzyme
MRRRDFLAASAGAALAAPLAHADAGAPAASTQVPLLGFADAPIESVDFTGHATAPLVLEKLELWRIGNRECMLVGRIRGGLTAYLPSNGRFLDDIELFTGRVLPFFLGQDLRRIEALIERCHRAHYKLSGLPFWNAIGHIEMLALEAIGLAAQRSVADLLGGAKRREVAVYLSSRERSTTPEQEIDEFMLPKVEATGARACKLGIGGRMSRNADAAPGRSEALVKRAREKLGDDFAICVDANGSYDAKAGIEAGRMLERYGVSFFEEPCPFEEFEMTRQVADALTVPVAGGEQDNSPAKWRWMIAQRVVDIVQPDLFYAGGFLRSLRVARLAATHGLQCVPHAPRAHAGAATLLQFVALLDNPGDHHEFAASSVGRKSKYAYDPVFVIRDGRIGIPDRPGFGVTYDAAELRRIAEPIAFQAGAVEEGD